MTSTFWDWSLTVYNRPGLADTLIALQDEAGLDVNLILWCCWCGATGRGETPEFAIRSAVEMSKNWADQVTAPLRAARRALKTTRLPHSEAAADALRDKVKAVELESERLLQLQLEHILPPPDAQISSPDAAAARRSLAAYAAFLGAPRRPGFSTTNLQTVVEIVFPADDD